MLLWLTITHWLWILLLKVWLLLDGGFKWIVLRSDKELIARNKSPEQWRKATHMEWLGDTGYYGEGMVSLTARTAYNFISSCFAGCWQWCVTLALEEEGKHESHFRSHLHSVSVAAWNNHVSLRAYMHISGSASAVRLHVEHFHGFPKREIIRGRCIILFGWDVCEHTWSDL